jgi:hypothetical protein
MTAAISLSRGDERASAMSADPKSRRGRPRRDRPRFCTNCDRPMNLGRYKTDGETCGTCKKLERRRHRVVPPMYASFDEVARQLEDDSPIPGDPYTGG